MLLDHLITKLEAQFAGQYSVAEGVVSFPAKHQDVGSVEVHDDAEELTVYAGHFTHLHFSSFDSSLTPQQAAERIAEDVTAFLVRLFSDQVVLWGSHGGRGGCYERGTGPTSIFSFRRGQEYVWSGPIPKQG